MNHQEAKDLLERKLDKETLSLIKVEVFRLSWQGKGYNIVAEESGYDHDYVRKAGSQLWKELSAAMGCNVTKRNFRALLEAQLQEESNDTSRIPEYPGGVISFSSPFYIERTQEEASAYQEIQRPGSIVRIKGPRKMGKSSLMLRVLDHADSEGYHHVIIDLMQADRSILSDLSTFLRWLCLQISSRLNLPDALDEYWNDLVGSKLSCSNYLQDYILAKVDKPIVLVINELNLLFDYTEVSQDFLPLLRSWHEEAKHNQQMQKLRQLLIYSTEVYVQLDINLSPFNVGLPIELAPFDGEQLQELAKVYGFNWKHDESVNSPITQLLTKLGGHPYLVQLALYHLVSQEGFIESPSAELKKLLAQAGEPGGLYNDFLQQLLADFLVNERAITALKKLLGNQKDQLTRIELYILERMGVIKVVQGKPEVLGRLITTFLQSNVG